MVIVCIAVAAFMAAGIYMILSEKLKLPARKASRAVAYLTGKNKSFDEKFVCPLAHKIEPFIKMNPLKRENLMQQISIVGLRLTPEFHVAVALVKSFYLILASLLLIPISPILTCIFAIASIWLFFKNKAKMSVEAVRKQKAAENELAPFVSYVVQSLNRRQDVFSIIQGYRSFSGPAFGRELDMLLVNMRTKGVEAALNTFETRLNSPFISDLVRGLIGIQHGENMQVYLSALEARMDAHEIAAKKSEAEERADNLLPANYAMMASMLAVYMCAFGIYIFQCFKSWC